MHTDSHRLSLDEMCSWTRQERRRASSESLSKKPTRKLLASSPSKGEDRDEDDRYFFCPLTLTLSRKGGRNTLTPRLRTGIFRSRLPFDFIHPLRSAAFEKSPGRFMVE